MSKPEHVEPYRLTRTRIDEIDRATPDWETLEQESDYGPRAHVRLLLEHIAYLEAERARYLRLARAGMARAEPDDVQWFHDHPEVSREIEDWGGGS